MLTEYVAGVDSRDTLIVHLSEVNTLWLHPRAFVHLTTHVPQQLTCAHRCKAETYVADASQMWTTAEFWRKVWLAKSDGDSTIDKAWREVFRNEVSTTFARELCRIHKNAQRYVR